MAGNGCGGNRFDRLSDGFKSCKFCRSHGSSLAYDNVGWLIVMHWVGGCSIGDRHVNIERVTTILVQWMNGLQHW